MGRGGPWWHALDYVFLMRPTLMPSVWSLFLFGLCHAPGFGDAVNTPAMFFPLFLLTLVAGAGYIHNQIYDIESDRINNKLFLLPEGHISVASAQRWYYTCTGLAIGAAFLYDWRLGSLITLSAVLSYGYNAPPFRWKDRPFAGVLSNSIGYGYVAFAIGWISASSLEHKMFLDALPYAAGCGSYYLLTTVLDTKGDEAADKITMGVKFGFTITVVVANLILLLGIIMAFINNNNLVLTPYLISLPLFLWIIMTKKIAHAKIALGFSTLAFSAAAMVCYPPYFIALLLLLIMIKLYYKHRFNFDYPPFRIPKESMEQ